MFSLLHRVVTEEDTGKKSIQMIGGWGWGVLWRCCSRLKDGSCFTELKRKVKAQETAINVFVCPL